MVHLVETVVTLAEMAMVVKVRETVEMETETEDADDNQIGGQAGQEAAAIQEEDLMVFRSWTSTRMTTTENDDESDDFLGYFGCTGAESVS